MRDDEVYRCFRSNNITATNQQALKRGNTTLKKRENNTKTEEQFEPQWQSYACSEPLVATCMALSTYDNMSTVMLVSSTKPKREGEDQNDQDKIG